MPAELKDCIMTQIERTRALTDSDCFIHIIKYITHNNNLYVVSQQCLTSLKDYVQDSFHFVETGKQRNSVLFTGPDKYPIDFYDLNNANSPLGKTETLRQANAHFYFLVSFSVADHFSSTTSRCCSCSSTIACAF